MKGYLIGKKPKKDREPISKFSGILMLSAWGFAMVLSSFLFLYVGYIIDEILGTTQIYALFLYSRYRIMYLDALQGCGQKRERLIIAFEKSLRQRRGEIISRVLFRVSVTLNTAMIIHMGRQLPDASSDTTPEHQAGRP